MKSSNVKDYSRFSDFDIDLFRSGKHFRLYEKMGSFPMELEGEKGCYFAVYAPGARTVGVKGDFNAWDPKQCGLKVRWDGSGIWEGFIPGAAHGQRYKYEIESDHGEGLYEKGDPFARYWEHPPNTASIIWDENYAWRDAGWMKKRSKSNDLSRPFAVYEVHPGSWMYNTDENRHLNWEELTDELPQYVEKMGFTHVEFMPIMEYPYEPSWGYQLTGYFASSSRFGAPGQCKAMIDALHQKGIGVILDWVPSHFPADKHGLGMFDGTHVYEHPDPRKGFHPDWKSNIFNYGRPEVRSFLISNALFWCDQFHADGLRVDAVASMLYLDYSREEGEWEPNQYGGRENLDAIGFLQDLNMAVHTHYPDVRTIAEESTSYSGVTRPVEEGGLGFDMKWMMGWMNDNLRYFEKDPIYRKHHQNDWTFSLAYGFSERFMLPLSHDEVVYGKKSLVRKMPGDDWQQFANLRLMFGWMYTHPGTKLIFMGGEFGQTEEWNFQHSLDWHLLAYGPHRGMQRYVQALNKLYASAPALHQKQFDPDGFEWVDFNDAENSVISFIRKPEKGNPLMVVCNATPTMLERYRVGSDADIQWEEVLNSDADEFGGSGATNKSVQTIPSPWHGRSGCVELTLPPLGMVVLKPNKKQRK